MRKNILTILLIAMLTGCSSSNNGSSGERDTVIQTWSKAYDSRYDFYNVSHVIQTQDEGFIVAGDAADYNYGGPWLLMKTNNEGSMLWINEEYYNWTGGVWANANDVKETIDGNFVTVVDVMSMYSVPPTSSSRLIKIDPHAHILLEKTIAMNYNGKKCIQLTQDGGFIIVGEKDLINTDNQGNEIWSKTYSCGEDNQDSCNVSRLQITDDGGYIIVGSIESLSGGNTDVYLIRTDSEGNEIWNKTYGGEEDDSGRWVQITDDGGFVIVGSTSSYGAGDRDIYLIRTDSEGNEIWSKTYGGEEGAGGSCLQITDDGGFIILGTTSSRNNMDAFIIRTDSEGNEIWSRTHGGEDHDRGISIQITDDGGFVVAGVTKSFGLGGERIWLLKLNENGELN